MDGILLYRVRKDGEGQEVTVKGGQSRWKKVQI